MQNFQIFILLTPLVKSNFLGMNMVDEIPAAVSSDCAESPISYICMSSPSTSSTSASNENLNENVGSAFKDATKRQMAFYGASMLKKACREVYHLDLNTFLDKTVTGKFILNTYHKDKRFSRKLRSQLSYILINGVMSENSNPLIPIDFEILSEKICQLFPTETKSTYYIPRVPGTATNRPVNPKGKLIDKYRNLRRLYNITNPVNDEVTATASCSSISNNTCGNEELSSCVDWLRTYQEPWDLVIQNWKRTFPLRKIESHTATVEGYMTQWPILKHRDAYALIEIDFQLLHPNCPTTSLLTEYQRWERFFDKLQNMSKIDKTTEQFLCSLTADITQDSKNAIQIAALPMLFPPKSRIRCKNTHWKPSIIECQESLIVLVSTCGNIDEVIKEKRDKLSALNLTVQPFLVVVGASFSCVTECYLVVDNNIYKNCSVLQGLDFAFKAFHSLNAHYPKECEHIWLLVERVLYKIEASDIKIPAVLTLLKDLENI